MGGIPPECVVVEERVEQFLRHLAAERGASEHTLRAYRRDLDAFRAYIRAEAADIEPVAVRGFVASLMKAGLKKSTVGRRLAAVRSFFRFLHREGVVPSNPARSVQAPKLPRLLPKFLTVDDVFSLVEKPEGIGFLPARDRAILELLYASGLRVAELSGLNQDDLNIREGLVKVRGKGRKERITPVGSKALDALKAYRIERVLLKKKDRAFFLNRNGSRLTDRGIRRVVVKYARAALLSGRVGPHTLRHTFATHLLHGGADLRVIQELLGHASLSTTQKYTHLDIAHLMDVYDKAHPLSGEEKL